VTGEVVLLEGLGIAGGFLPTADLEGAIVIRDAKLMPKGVADVALRGEVSRNVFLRDGDLVYIPDNVAKKVFVLGEVQRPDAVQIERNAVSLAEVLAMCGGPTPARARRELAIIRGGFDKPTVYIVDLEKAGHPGRRHRCPGHEQRDQLAAAGGGAMTPTWVCADCGYGEISGFARSAEVLEACSERGSEAMRGLLAMRN
jgi:protein involved in polysaccharide export with SLBB domain